MKSYRGFTPLERRRARNWLRDQWRTGARRRPRACNFCGTRGGILEAHTEDYSEPFGGHIGEWAACYVCHMMIHNRHHFPGAFRGYLSILESGRRVAKFRRRDWSLFKDLSSEIARTGDCSLAVKARIPPDGPVELSTLGERADSLEVTDGNR
jgi:hypothetical protein